MGSVFSNLVSITRGLHRDSRSEKDFEHLNTDWKNKHVLPVGIYKVNFKKPLSSKKRYYFNLISIQVENEIDLLNSEFEKPITEYEYKYLYKVHHEKYNKYLRDISSYINEQVITSEIINDNDYIINYLKVSAIRLYLELQDRYGEYSDNPKYNALEVAEKYFQDVDFDDAIIQKSNTDITRKNQTKKTKKAVSKKTPHFGFKGEDTSKLRLIISLLHLKIDMLDLETTEEDFFDLLLAENYTKFDKTIHLNCETTQFSYIVSRLKPYFSNFTPKSIEDSKRFYTKTNTLLRANNLYKNKVHNTKEKEEIDRIIQQLQ